MYRILYQDEHFVAIHKPPGIMVHRTGITEDKRFVLQELRDQLGQYVYPVHRLDRGTAGVLLFGLHAEAASAMMPQFADGGVRKHYLAVVRGHMRESGRLSYPLARDGHGEMQEAVTAYEPLAIGELPIPVDRYASSRYSWMHIQPETGRMHQIRRHFAHLRHPIIGDKKRGDRHHNRMFREELDCHIMLLLAWQLHFDHPWLDREVRLVTTAEPAMQAVLDRMGWKMPEELKK